MVIFHTDFGLIWTTPWPDEKDLFLNFANREICKVPYENLTFFLSYNEKLFWFFLTIMIDIP